ncbi:DUF6527 family protein [Variovorax boronicumulans]|uniref:DUF6527 family protein n=1 Tax=Variovorax boronicumulans TaxID=436515 RepID=UPI0036F289AF
MSGRRIKDSGDGQGRIVAVSFTCPGCRLSHTLYTQHTPADLAGPRWTFNGDYARPTLQPSILARGGFPGSDPESDGWDENVVCHSFVTDGRIQFLGDCTHAMAGKTVDLPEIGP